MNRKFSLLLLPLLVVAGLGIVMVPRGGIGAPALSGTLLPGEVAAGFTLTDQSHQRISMRQLRGHPVVITFIHATCTELCPLIALKLHRILGELGPSGKKVEILAISTDPEGDSPVTVRRFSQKYGMLHLWHYLTGSRAQLTPVWASYYVYAPPANAPAAIRDQHTGATYIIDGQGKERVLLGGDPDTADLRRDLRILLGLPVAATQVSNDPAPDIGHPAPDFALRALDGSRIRLRDLRGKIVLLNFWATWCHACRSEMPALASWYWKMSRRGVVVVGIDRQESRSDVRSYVESLHVSYPIALDAKGDVDNNYDVAGLPTSYFIDRRGIVQDLKLGALDRAWLQQGLAIVEQAG